MLCVAAALVNKMKIYLPPLHINLWLMNISTKGMNQEGEGFKYLRQKFSSVREAKIKEGIFVSQVKQQFQNLTSKINWKLLREELGIHLKTYAATFWDIKIRKLHRNNGANFLIPCLGVQHISETPFHAIPLGLSPGKYWSHLWQAWSKVPSGYNPNGREILQQMEPKYVGWVLLDACTGDTNKKIQETKDNRMSF